MVAIGPNSLFLLLSVPHGVPKQSFDSYLGPFGHFESNEHLGLLKSGENATISDPKGGVHTQITSQGYKLKKCVYCASHHVRSKSGYIVYCRFMCQQCDVALCKGTRSCFQMYHKELFSEQKQSDTPVTEPSQYIL